LNFELIYNYFFSTTNCRLIKHIYKERILENVKYICQTSGCIIAFSQATFPAMMNCPMCNQTLKTPNELSDLDTELINKLPYIIAEPLKRTILEEHAFSKINLLKDTFLNYLKYLALITASEFFDNPKKDKGMVALFHQSLTATSFGKWNHYIMKKNKVSSKSQSPIFLPRISSLL